jgi:hypothetical protein
VRIRHDAVIPSLHFPVFFSALFIPDFAGPADCPRSAGPAAFALPIFAVCFAGVGVQKAYQ